MYKTYYLLKNIVKLSASNLISVMKIVIIIFCILNIIFSQEIFSQWQISHNGGSGFVSAIHVRSNSVFAGNSTQGMFRSDDNGITWIQINSGLTSLNVQCVTSTSDFIFAGTVSEGVFRSSDNGAGWTRSSSGIGQQNIKELIDDDSSVFAGCIFAGIFRTSNSGTNWSRFGLGEGDLMRALLYNQNTFLVGLHGGMYRTTNYGTNWGLAQSGITNLDIMCLEYGLNKFWCGTFGGGIFISTNNGAQWTPLNSGLTELYINKLFSDGENVFAATLNGGVFYFNANSNSWTAVNEGLTDTNIVSISGNNKYIFAGTPNGRIWKRPINEIITDIQTHESIVNQFQLHQNFPNPFNPVTLIKFSINKSSHTKLIIFDASGKKAATLVDENLASGSYSVQWDAGDFASGVYFAALHSGNFLQMKKMILVR